MWVGTVYFTGLLFRGGYLLPVNRSFCLEHVVETEIAHESLYTLATMSSLFNSLCIM